MGRRQIASTIIRASLVAVLCYAILLIISWLSLNANQVFAAQQVSKAFQSGDLGDYDIRGANARLGTHQLNDCLILDQAISRSGTLAQMAVTPPNDLADRSAEVCKELRRSVDGAASRQLNFYQNYIHGHTIAARALLSVLPVSGIRQLYSLIVVSILIVGLWITMRQALRVGATAAVIFWLCYFVAFARFFGVEFFSQSLGHGPADAVFLGYGLWFATVSFRADRQQIDFVTPAAVFGALTATFEFLTGGIPLGLALTIAGVTVAEPQVARLRGSITRAVLSFATAIGTMVAIKVALTVAVFGFGAVLNAGSQLAERVGGAAQLEQDGPISLASIGVKLTDGLAQMVGDKSAFAMMLLLLSLAFGAMGYIKLMDSPFAQRAKWIAASNLVLVAWVVVFNHHFYVHAWFMVRIFAWTIATGFALFALAVAIERRPQGVPAE
jgi:hypothetical protein